MEIVHELEKKGRSGYLYLIDSSLSIIKWLSRVLYRDQGFLTNSTAFVRALRPAIDMKKVSPDFITDYYKKQRKYRFFNSVPS